MNTEEYLNGYYSISKQNDENNAITNPVEIHYVESYAKEYLKNINNDSDEMFKTKYFTEYQNYNKKEIIKYSFSLYGVMIDLYNHHLKQFYNSNIKYDSIYTLFSSQLEIFQGSITLTLSDSSRGVISLFRTMYENYIIIKFLLMNTELIKEYNSNANEIKNTFDRLLSNNNEYINENYSWAKLKGKKYNLKSMAEAVGIGNSYFAPYRISCEIIHASAFSSIYSDYTKILIDLFFSTSIEILTNSFVSILKSVNCEKEYSRGVIALIYTLREEMFGG